MVQASRHQNASFLFLLFGTSAKMLLLHQTIQRKKRCTPRGIHTKHTFSIQSWHEITLRGAICEKQGRMKPHGWFFTSKNYCLHPGKSYFSCDWKNRRHEVDLQDLQLTRPAATIDKCLSLHLGKYFCGASDARLMGRWWHILQRLPPELRIGHRIL